MRHITEAKIDLLILNKNLLGNEAIEIESHLKECEVCRKIFDELKSYYSEFSKLPNEKGNIGIISKSLKSRSIQGIQDLKFILKTRESTEEESIRLKVINFLKSLFLPVPGYTPAYRFVGPAVIILIILLAYYLFKPETEKYKAFEDKKIDTTKQIEEKNQYANIDTIKKELTQDSTKIIEKEKKKIEKEYGLLAYADIEAGTRGDEPFKFISLVSKKSGVAELVVYKREKKIVLNEDTIKHYIKSGMAKLYSFPRTEVNKGLEKKQNRICNVDQTADGDYDVYVSETENTKNCWENEALKYKFDKNFNLKQIEYSDKFNSVYQKLQSENKINISITIESYLSKLKYGFKEINK